MKTNGDPQGFRFHLAGERGEYELNFWVDKDNIETSCNCAYSPAHKLCWHRCYVLAGKTERLKEDERPQQKLLINLLSSTTGGRELIQFSKNMFGEQENCRRCGRLSVIQLDKPFHGRFLSLFVNSSRKYLCWRCWWSW